MLWAGLEGAILLDTTFLEGGYYLTLVGVPSKLYSSQQSDRTLLSLLWIIHEKRS